MEKFERKERKSARGFTYSYYIYRPSTATKPAIVLCHGWPDNASLYADIIPALLNLSHPILVPDLLGYDGSSKPTDLKAYNSKGVADDLYDIIDAEGFDKIIPAGHDWGSWIAQRLYIWRPERCKGLILLNVAYMPPHDEPFDLEASLDMTESAFGYPTFAYWDVFAAEDGPRLLGDNAEKVFHMIHWDDPEAVFKFFCRRGETRKMLQNDSVDQYPLRSYAKQPGFKDSWLKRMRRDGFQGPQAYYQSITTNLQYETEKDIPKENLTIKEPCLYIWTTGDAVCRPEIMEPAKHLVLDLETHKVEAGHWVPYEKPQAVTDAMIEWLNRRY